MQLRECKRGRAWLRTANRPISDPAPSTPSNHNHHHPPATSADDRRTPSERTTTENFHPEIVHFVQKRPFTKKSHFFCKVSSETVLLIVETDRQPTGMARFAEEMANLRKKPTENQKTGPFENGSIGNRTNWKQNQQKTVRVENNHAIHKSRIRPKSKHGASSQDRSKAATLTTTARMQDVRKLYNPDERQSEKGGQSSDNNHTQTRAHDHQPDHPPG